MMDPMAQMGMGNPMQKGGAFPTYQANTWGFKGSKGFKGGKGKGRGKGKGKMFFSDDDPRRQIMMAQRQAQQRDRAAIISAQKSAQQRFEKDLLDRVQGQWKDGEDATISYLVEGGVCSVSGQSSRTFRNRLSVYGGDLCWDAKRFWHYLNLNALPPNGEEVERVEWNPGQGSPPTKKIIWVRSTEEAEDVQEAEEGEAGGVEGDGSGVQPETG
eukprot:Skav225573  [mRNA]  locus=scaffold81:532300:532941:+ [translate_table: standard]